MKKGRDEQGIGDLRFVMGDWKEWNYKLRMTGRAAGASTLSP
jgi:hypothetical protein